MEKIAEIIHSRCEEVLKELPDGSIDLLCTDPPYGVSFMGKDWDKAVPSVEIWKECLRVLKPGSFAFVMSLPRADCMARMIINLETAGFVVAFTPIFWTFASGFPKAMNIGKAVDKKLGKKRKVVGKKRPEAKKLEGSYAGFQPKPAVEVIIVAMKPFKGTFVDQAIQTGKGITWLNDCKIPYTSEANKACVPQPAFNSPTGKTYGFKTGEGRTGEKFVASPEGRFPANLLVQEDVLNDGVERGSPKTYKRQAKGFNVASYGKGMGQTGGVVSFNFGDSGSFSRYFDLDRWFQEKLGKFSERLYRTYPFLIETKASNKEKWFYCRKCKKAVYAPEKKEHSRHTHFCETCRVHTGKPNRHKGHKVRSNFIFHPTVKPLKLMCYLVTMDSRKGDIILDPFAGTCKTGMAAEILGRQYVMVEQDEIAVKLGEAGIKAVIEARND